jgi:TonB family protein
VPPPVQPHPAVPRLAAPPLLDADARGAAYLTSVALSLQPAWHQFLEDCRLRLPAGHPLNEMSLVAIAELEIDPSGQVRDVRLATSGNADFDRAAKQVIVDASPLPKPPRELWSDDDHVHLAWTFARDRRQAGPATAQIIDVELPLRAAVDRWIWERDLSRAARKLARAAPSSDRDVVIERLMVAALREALESSDGAVRRAAVEAIGQAKLDVLAAEVRARVTWPSDLELRLAAIQTSAVLRDGEAADEMRLLFERQLDEEPRLALAAARGIAALGKTSWDGGMYMGSLSAAAPNPTALQALAFVPLPEVASSLPKWFRSPNARQRAGVCSALAGYSPDLAWPLLARGLADRDASVRASCLASTHAPRLGHAYSPTERAAIAAQKSAFALLRKLARDRDSIVRAQAVTALAALDPSELPNASGDPSAEVRAAYAAGLAASITLEEAALRNAAATRDSAKLREATAHLRVLADDRDPDVRAAAWTTQVAVGRDPELRARALRAASDAAPQVRRVAVRALDSDTELLSHASHDESSEVRTAALVELAGRRGRAASTELLLQRLADAPPGSGERVRTALAWLLAR